MTGRGGEGLFMAFDFSPLFPAGTAGAGRALDRLAEIQFHRRQ